MLSIFDSLRGLSLEAMMIRMLLAVLCGSIIGIEREFKRRPAGFRTHILICMGACITTLTSEYLLLVMNMNTDPARLGAQVIAGIGFIGAGTIIVTRHQRVKGLTTAAGLWAVAIVGLCIGSGFYEGAIMTTLLILIAEALFARVEYWIMRSSPEINILLEYRDAKSLDELLQKFRTNNVKLLHLEITRTQANDKRNACAILELRLPKKYKIKDLMETVHGCEGVFSVEEL
ncbi:MAG: MgtC/SapB family protein [Oscillospiraceae bacterium]|nr:MgtC/SapB family protein [Oscillospiraceae bacterium]